MPQDPFYRRIGFAALAMLTVTFLTLVVLGVIHGNALRAVAEAQRRSYRPAFATGQIPSPAPATPTVAFLGDSYTEGAGASDPKTTGWVALLAQDMGWKGVNFGCGGSGYTNPGLCNQTYDQRVSSMVATAPDIVLVSGGRNDVTGPTATIKTNAAQTFKDISTALPKAQILVLSPVWDSSSPPSGFDSLQATIRSTATAAGGKYVDIGEPLRGHRDWTIADAVHPNDKGHAALAAATLKALEAAGIKPVK